ncbi:MAG: hypothetical protein R8K20_07450, partial [Gallionellaceae bacterium]
TAALPSMPIVSLNSHKEFCLRHTHASRQEYPLSVLKTTSHRSERTKGPSEIASGGTTAGSDTNAVTAKRISELGAYAP